MRLILLLCDAAFATVQCALFCCNASYFGTVQCVLFCCNASYFATVQCVLFCCNASYFATVQCVLFFYCTMFAMFVSFTVQHGSLLFNRSLCNTAFAPLPRAYRCLAPHCATPNFIYGYTDSPIHGFFSLLIHIGGLQLRKLSALVVYAYERRFGVLGFRICWWVSLETKRFWGLRRHEGCDAASHPACFRYPWKRLVPTFPISWI